MSTTTRRSYFVHPESAVIALEYPQKLEQLPLFARFLATIGYEERDFQSALVWFSSWGVWPSFSESPGYRIVELMNAGAGQTKSFLLAPGHAFRADELVDSVGMLLQPMVFAWDSFYLPTWSFGREEFFLHVSHDSTVEVVTRTKAFHDRVFQLLEENNYNPRTGAAPRTKHFCRKS
jgi:hypothetical protein